MATAPKELLLGTLVLTYLSAITIASIQAFTNFFESGMKMVLISLTVCAAVLNSLSNPVIYFWRNQNPRKVLLEIIHRAKQENTSPVSKIQPFISKTFKESATNQETVLLLFSLLSAAHAKSGPLDFPSEKSFLLFFAHEKGLGHMFKK